MENKLKYTILTVLGLFISAVSGFGQAQTPEVETIINRADDQTEKYIGEFKDLLADETKTFELFDKNGNQKKRTVVQSRFLIFQSLRDEKVSSEYRDVVRVDDKVVKEADKRSSDLFAQLKNAESVRKELERIERESSRYDKNLQINGLTLFQTPVLGEDYRPYFEYRLADPARSSFDGADVYVIEYRQTKLSPYVLINEEGDGDQMVFMGLPKSLDKANVFLRGKLWIDAATFQIRREERELYLQSAGAPLTIFRGEFEYKPSEFEILVPQRIVYNYYEVKTKDKGRNVSATLNTRATFEYANFKRGRVDVQIGDDEEGG